jgi:hypothetical protein
MRQAPEQAIANLARTPVRFFFLCRHNCGFDLFRRGLRSLCGTKCNPCLRYVLLPMSRNGQAAGWLYAALRT